MIQTRLFFALACCLLPIVASAEELPARGKFLVASHDLQGPIFGESVILLLHYDDTGALGLVINRPSRIAPAEALPEFENLDTYRGTFFLGGPVERRTVRMLLRADAPPVDSMPVMDNVYLVPVDESLVTKADMDASKLRLYLGYAGWGPGQLDSEMQRGSWHVLPATGDTVFAEDPATVWQRLVPARRYQAALRPLIDIHQHSWHAPD